MSQRVKIYSLISLLLTLVWVLYANRSHELSFSGVLASSQGKFEPLNVPDPSLRLDLLDRIHKEEYTGTHRNIFSAAPPPPPPSAIKPAPIAPPVPTGPPPLEIPVTFYGIVTSIGTGRRQACFANSDGDVYIVAEGGTLLDRFRVLNIGNNTVNLEEISSGRTTTLTMVQPATGAPGSGPS